MPRTVLLVLALFGCTAPATECTEQTWYLDRDGDGFGDTFSNQLACHAPDGYANFGGDCDDSDPVVHPGAVDSCDGRDDNCDGFADDAASSSLWYADGDDDGVGGSSWIEACAAPPGFVDGSGDCDDSNDQVLPGGTEVCNGEDDDCDGVIDNNPTDPNTWWIDGDGDGYGDSEDDGLLACEAGPNQVDNDDDCDDDDDLRHPGAAERCNQQDDDCDGLLSDDELDTDGDGWSACDGDCEALNPAVSPQATEQVADGIDQDCDGLESCYLDADGDGNGGVGTLLSTDLLCDGVNESDNTGDCDDNDATVTSNAAEVPYDGVDNDCDTLTLDDDLDLDGYGFADDCDDTNNSVNPNVLPAVSFSDVTVSAGLWAQHWNGFLNPAFCGPEYMAGGVAAGDFDGDGFVDLFVSRMYANDLLYRNLGDGSFEEVGLAWGIDHAQTSNGAVFFDADGNGTLDLYVTSIGTEGNRLYINDGTQFTEQGISRGAQVLPAGPQCELVFGVSAADVDGDGDLDLHIVQWHGSAILQGDGSRLLTNDGTGYFTDTTLSSGIDLVDRAAFSTSFRDFDDDGDLDLAVAADWGQSGLWVNDGSGFFTEDLTAGVGTDENGMGSDVADFDGDGDLDWFVSAVYDTREPCLTMHHGCSGNRLYVNDGTGNFTDGTDAAGVRDGGWGWGASFFDYDNDGDLDLAHGNGFTDSYFIEDSLRLFQNDGSGVFQEVACEAQIGLERQQRGLISLDVDNDGDLDVFTTQSFEEPRLFLNEGGDTSAWLRVQASESGNAFGVGATVWVQATAASTPIRRDIHANGTFVGTGPQEAHFGLGAHEADLFEVQVVWPDGTVRTLNNVPVRQILQVSRQPS